jgi:hypothetical protein
LQARKGKATLAFKSHKQVRASQGKGRVTGNAIEGKPHR